MNSKRSFNMFLHIVSLKDYQDAYSYLLDRLLLQVFLDPKYFQISCIWITHGEKIITDFWFFKRKFRQFIIIQFFFFLYIGRYIGHTKEIFTLCIEPSTRIPRPSKSESPVIGWHFPSIEPISHHRYQQTSRTHAGAAALTCLSRPLPFTQKCSSVLLHFKINSKQKCVCSRHSREMPFDFKKKPCQHRPVGVWCVLQKYLCSHCAENFCKLNCF